VIVGLKAGKTLEGKKGKETFVTERGIVQVTPEEFDALVIPGGYSPDKLRVSAEMVALVRELVSAGKPVAAVCHAPWMLAEAEVIRGKTVTSWPSIKTDLVNAGARWVDQEVVEEGNLITSRNPGDLEAFSEALLRQIEGRRKDEAGAQVGA
jgi:protease I